MARRSSPKSDAWWRRWLDARARERWVAQRRAAYEAHLRSDYWLALRRQALARARHRCEWVLERGPKRGQRCGCVEHLEVHHQHYATFGHETLADVQVLCPAHHAIADRRRAARRVR